MGKLGDMIPEEQANAMRKENHEKKHFTRTRSYVKTSDSNYVDTAIEKFGKESVELALIVKNNAEIRRFTSKNILAHLAKENKASLDDHVEFLWNKFKVVRKIDGNSLSTEYLYTESFFIKALINSFEQFSESAGNTIAAFANSYSVEVPSE